MLLDSSLRALRDMNDYSTRDATSDFIWQQRPDVLYRDVADEQEGKLIRFDDVVQSADELNIESTLSTDEEMNFLQYGDAETLDILGSCYLSTLNRGRLYDALSAQARK